MLILVLENRGHSAHWYKWILSRKCKLIGLLLGLKTVDSNYFNSFLISIFYFYYFLCLELRICMMSHVTCHSHRIKYFRPWKWRNKVLLVSMQCGWVIHTQLAPGNLGSAPSEWDVPARESVSMTINRQL